MEDKQELTTLDEHPDRILQRRIANGEVTKEEVERVWSQTENLSPQTPFEIRKAVVEMKAAGYEMTPAEQFTLSAVLDLRAALYRDESKFAHLVAGTETVVESLRNVNALSATIDELKMSVQMLQAAMEQKKRRFSPFRWIREWFWLRKEDTELVVTVDEPYNRKIGSSWDANNPRKA